MFTDKINQNEKGKDYLLAILKVAGALAILLPAIPDRLKEWAYGGLTFNLIFAMISHADLSGNLKIQGGDNETIQIEMQEGMDLSEEGS